MTQSEKLQKVIERAVENGWKPESIGPFGIYENDYDTIWSSIDEIDSYSLNDVLFGTDFAKAYFGNEMVDSYGNTLEEYKEKIKKGVRYAFNYVWNGLDLKWGFGLKQLALTPPSERIDYLFSFIENEKG